jgi:hypothetical protein
MPRFRLVPEALVFGVVGALVGVVPAGVSAVAPRAGCRPTAFVTNQISGTVSTIDAGSHRHPRRHHPVVRGRHTGR